MKPLSAIKEQRKVLMTNFILVTILSFGISLVINYLTDPVCLLNLFLGLVFLLIVTFYYVKEYFARSSYEASEETVITLDNKNHKVIPINRFKFSNDLNMYYTSVIKENKTYESLWAEAFTSNSEKGKKFVKEFLDALFISQLSLNLNSFFSEIGDDYVEVIGREQIPDVLLKNRVIEMISKPFEEREKFQNTDGQQEPLENGIVVMKISEDGVLYDRLEIELPKHSTVKIENDSFVIKNRNFTITFHASFDGFSAVMPSFFSEYYMKKAFREIASYQIKLKMSIRLKPLFLLSFRDWRYLGWLDQIGDAIMSYFSFDGFIERIGYEQALTNHIMFLNGLKRNNKAEKTENKPSLRFTIVEKDVM